MKCELIDYMGDDLRVANAARVSFDKESEWSIDEYDGQPTPGKLGERDVKLIHYLASHNHFTPFTHCVVTLRETVPIFVARQRFKHMVGFSYNEVSRRYVDTPPEFFVPNQWRSRPEGNRKQGSGSEVIDLSQKYMWKDDPTGMWDDYTVAEMLSEHYERTNLLYNRMLEISVAPEQARMVLPQSMYTSYYVTGSLYAFARAYNLRSDPHSQKEIQDLAKQWDEIIRPLFPVSWGALVDI